MVKSRTETLGLGWIPRIMGLVLNPWNARFQPHPAHQNHSQETKTHTESERSQKSNSCGSQDRNALHPMGSGKNFWLENRIPLEEKVEQWISQFLIRLHVWAVPNWFRSLSGEHICASYVSDPLFIQLCALWTSFTVSPMPTFPA